MNTIRTEEAPEYRPQDVSLACKPDIFTPSQWKTILDARSILSNAMLKHGTLMTSPDAVKTYLQTFLTALEHEQFFVLFLDNQHRLIRSEMMFRGTIDGASVYPREVAKRALYYNAAAVIFAHNHPSGKQDPSDADVKITRKLKDALDLFEIRVLDHFIMGEGVFSFAERGMI